VNAVRAWRPSTQDVVVAAHEASHAILGIATGARVPVVSIVPSGDTDGHTILHRDVPRERRRQRRTRVSRVFLRHEAILEAQVALAGRAGEQLVTGWPQFAADPEWLDYALDWDSDLRRALECVLCASAGRRSVLAWLASAYDAALAYLFAHTLHVNVLVGALLEYWVIDPQRFLAELPPVGAPTPTK